MSKEETPPIIRWLHRRVFRGLGFVIFAGVLSQTIVFLERACHGRAH